MKDKLILVYVVDADQEEKLSSLEKALPEMNAHAMKLRVMAAEFDQFSSPIEVWKAKFLACAYGFWRAFK